MIAALSGTSLSFAATSEGTTVGITLASSLQSGKFADVSQLSGSFTVNRGQAQVISGVELFKIELGKAEWSDEALIDIFLMNGDELGRVLGNPNAYIEVAVWYPDSSGTHNVGPSNNTTVKRDDSAVAKLTAATGAAKLEPSIDDESTLYILAEITVPGGAPPGQQGKTDLEFTINTRQNN